MLCVFAEESSDTRTAALMAVAGAISVGSAKLFEFLWSWVKENKGEKASEKKTITDHLNTRVERLESEKVIGDLRISKLIRRIRKAENSNTQMLAHIIYLERLMKGKNMEFDPYKEIALPPEDCDTQPNTGTDAHTPIGGS